MFSARSTLRMTLALAVCTVLALASPGVTAGLFSEGDDDIPGVSTTSPAEGAFPDIEDAHDIFSVRVLDGEIFKAALYGSVLGDFDLALLSTRFVDDQWLACPGKCRRAPRLLPCQSVLPRFGVRHLLP